MGTPVAVDRLEREDIHRYDHVHQLHRHILQPGRPGRHHQPHQRLLLLLGHERSQLQERHADQQHHDERSHGHGKLHLQVRDAGRRRDDGLRRREHIQHQVLRPSAERRRGAAELRRRQGKVRSLMAQYFSPKIVTNNLVLMVDAGNPKAYPGSGTTVGDLSGNGRSVVLVNGPTVSLQGITLDGTNDYATIAHGGALSFSTGNFTICAWNRCISSFAGLYGGIITNDNTTDNAWKFYKDNVNAYVCV